jgi:CBS domain-containing protein
MLMLRKQKSRGRGGWRSRSSESWRDRRSGGSRRRSSGGRLRRLLAKAPLLIAGGTAVYVARRLTGGGEDAHGRTVREAMTPNPSSIAPNAPIAEAARRMRDEDVGSLPVVENGRLVGMLTDRDITVRVVAEGRDAQEATVGDAASRDLTRVTPDQDLDEALRLMAARQVRRLPVVEGERLVGIVAQADVAQTGDRHHVGEAVGKISEPTGAARG